ncbi:hypothetical protein Rhe02_74850 [Rhizocola hellebori]|uniref:SRPBCC family protein n=1 Tax=Rhizocola hellebori TaxID=1392758 RepID=A0A8J3VKU2_9ACTN|nr:SRPBCC family protein [Rhizocola hellebori]GIH09418.1 hypothetical protein Rhe02_74850 [Rhizocola hellebori]
MAAVGAHIVIARPIVEVYDFVTDLRNDPTWWSGISRSVRVAGEGGVGTRYQLEARLLGVSLPTQIDVIEAERPHRMTIKAEGKLPYVARYTLAPAGNGTRFAIYAEIEQSPWRQLAPVLSMVMRHHMRSLNRVLTN